MLQNSKYYLYRLSNKLKYMKIKKICEYGNKTSNKMFLITRKQAFINLIQLTASSL